MKSTGKEMLPLVVVVAAAAAIAVTGCSGGSAVRNIQGDPFSDSFFEIARFIMLDDEIDIFKHLPDAEARRQFIEEFWQRRDPDPQTPENEFKAEFERRIAFANRWFREGGRKGWDTERGRILLTLGLPDRRDYGAMVSSEYSDYLIGGMRPPGMEVWEYTYFQMVLIFVDMKGFGDFKLEDPPPQLGSAMDEARSVYAWNPGQQKKNRPIFGVRLQDDGLHLLIPLKRITFQREGETLRAQLKVSVVVYHDYQKQAPKTMEFIILEKESVLLEKKEWPLLFPLALTEKGKYTFEVVLSDQMGGTSALEYHHGRL